MILNNNINKEETIMPNLKFSELQSNYVRVEKIQSYIENALSNIVKHDAMISVNGSSRYVFGTYSNLILNSHDGYAEPLGALVLQLEIDQKVPESEHTRPTLHGEFDVTLKEDTQSTHLSFDVQEYQFDFEEDKFIFPEDMQFTIVPRR